MARIKGWRKYLDRNDRVVWHSAELGRYSQIIVEKAYNAFTGDKYWFVESLKSAKGFPNIKTNLKKTRTKEEALDYARVYMRSHPNG